MAIAVLGAAVGGVEAAPSVGHPRFVVDRPVAVAYQPIHVRVVGLYPGDRVTIGSSAYDYSGALWQASAVFTADGSGTVDLADRAPVSGSYSGADAMGLFWSMNPAFEPSQDAAFGTDYPEREPDSTIELTVSDSTGRLADTTLTREWIAPGVTHKSFTLAANGVIGDLYLPPPGAAPRPAVLEFGGSEGGESGRWKAAVLASEGYPALAIGYFDLPGLPKELADIPLEYFATAARLLAAQPGVDPAHVVVMSASRGSEAALLSADHFPELIHGAIVYAPSAVVNTGFPDTSATAWTLGGVAVPTDLSIPLGDVSGPVLAITGSADALWPSPRWTRQIENQLELNDDRYPHQILVYPGAGHGISGDVDGPASTTSMHPVIHRLIDLGGSRQANAAGEEQAWGLVLALLGSLR